MALNSYMFFPNMPGKKNSVTFPSTRPRIAFLPRDHPSTKLFRFKISTRAERWLLRFVNGQPITDAVNNRDAYFRAPTRVGLELSKTNNGPRELWRNFASVKPVLISILYSGVYRCVTSPQMCRPTAIYKFSGRLCNAAARQTPWSTVASLFPWRRIFVSGVEEPRNRRGGSVPRDFTRRLRNAKLMPADNDRRG